MAMTSRLDRKSRDAITRFGFKLGFAFIFAVLSRQAFFLVTSLWLSLYALATCAIAIITRDRLRQYSFGHWDEAIWLSACAVTFKVVDRLT